MIITDVRIYEVNKGKMLASASVTLDDTLVVTGFRVMDGSKGLFVANPSTQWSDGSYHDTVFCLTKDGREEIEAAILNTYYAEQAEKEKKPAPKYSRKK